MRPLRSRRLRSQVMSDFDIKAHGEDWLLTPSNRAARTWCRSNLAEGVGKSGDGYVVKQEHLLLIIDELMESKSKWFGF